MVEHSVLRGWATGGGSNWHEAASCRARLLMGAVGGVARQAAGVGDVWGQELAEHSVLQGWAAGGGSSQQLVQCSELGQVVHAGWSSGQHLVVPAGGQHAQRAAAKPSEA